MHETAHLIIASFLGVPTQKLKLHPFGVSLVFTHTYIKSPLKEIAISLAGPIFNLVFSIAIIIFMPNIDSTIIDQTASSLNFSIRDTLVIVNLGLAAINLIPILPLDGGRALKAYLTEKWGIIRAYNFTMTLSKILISLAIAATIIYIIFYAEYNFSVLIILSFLMGNILQEGNYGKLIIMRDIIYAKGKLTGGAQKSRHIAALNTYPARKLLKSFSYNCYYIIDVLDERGRVVDTLSEEEIIDAILQKGSRVKVGKVRG
jgi:stage IV sporulation protein FB